MTRRMSGYNEIAFPPCGCPTRKAGDVVMVVRFASLLLTSDPPNAEIQVEISWDDIIEYHVDEGGRAFQFNFKREGKRAKPIKLFSNYAEYMAECFAQILFERQVASNWKPTRLITESVESSSDHRTEIPSEDL
ncbi:hypothetical protein ANCDUO_21182 [Ancylostoma duodenale]|uniref:Uncharacterized protein n=1 Tax=Ancylostoma duodenale TaxID=51022 RepID=A0A0C2FJF1_9BILA|nr:hypothetical protein ANCDUO_21182 [Ancylostoma duodenale]